MASTDLRFASRDEHRAWLQTQAALPLGFRVGSTTLQFIPVEVHKPSKMTLTLLTTDTPTESFAAVFTKNTFPGAPILLGRRRVEGARLGAILVNNKVSNVCAPGGVESSERLCTALASQLRIAPEEVLPSSTGVIGWRLPTDAMEQALPSLVTTLQNESIFPAADGIMTTDLYPKIRRAQLPSSKGTATLVGIAKGAGMIEPNLATMLVFLLTDADLPRDVLRAALRQAVDETFHCMTIDSDTSTSDTVALLSSQRAGQVNTDDFQTALTRVCADLCEDIVRNGEGVHHVMEVTVRGAPNRSIAIGVGKSVVNSPLFQCAVCGNDPNVGRLVMAIGKFAGARDLAMDPQRVHISMGGNTIFRDGAFRLDPATEEALVAHFRAAELYASVPPPDGVTFKPPVRFPPHEKRVQITIDLGLGYASATVLGADRTHEYISENADYRT